ncbi:MAG: hypothetical protein H7X92_09760 [Chitinophagales bacterium]|nr:hypothetical protein [Hyphomicrobiales bacterium]
MAACTRQAARGAQLNGEVLITDGPYLSTKQHIAVFWLREAAALDDALVRVRKAGVVCQSRCARFSDCFTARRNSPNSEPKRTLKAPLEVHLLMSDADDVNTVAD